MEASRPENEEERLAALVELELLDTAPEPEFDEIVALAARIADAPIALVSLVDREREWFKAKVGLDDVELPREVAFCAHAILNDELFVVTDARVDPRFCDNPLVTGDPHIRFYAGTVLRTDAGHPLGTLCVIDRRPREASDELRGALRALGHAASSMIELRRRRMRELELVAQRSQISQDLKRRKAMLRQIADVQRGILVGEPSGEVLERLLDALLKASESEYGFIGEVMRDEKGPYLKTHAITDIAWDEASRRLHDEKAAGGLIFRNLDTLFGEVIRSGAPVIANEPANDPRRGGLPPGHPALTAFLGVPCFADGELSGVFGVANRPGGYDEGVIAEIEVLQSTFAGIISHLRLERMRREAEGERRRSDARLRDIIDLASDAIVCFDGRGVISVWNPEAERIFGGGADEAIGRDVVELVLPAEERAAHSAAFARALDGSDGRLLHRPFEVEGVRRDGRRVPLEISLSRMSSEREQILSAFIRDATPRKESERALRERSDELAEVNAVLAGALRVKDEFLATVSHELRTPLQAVIGLSGALVSGHYGELRATQSEILRIIGKSGELLLQLINDLLDLSKIGAEQLALSAESVDVGRIVEECVDQFRGAAEQKSLRLSFSVDPTLPIVRLDPLRFKQILLNLMSNAVKFTSVGGVEVEVRYEPSAGRMSVAVRDTGIGIPEDQRERIFEPFTQLDGGLRRHHAGTGLGLALTRRLVDLFGGEIEVAGADGGGSVFTVRLPVEPAAPREETPADAVLRSAPPCRVLIAEDNDVNVLTISAFLEAAGHHVTVARNGREAVEVAHRERPDVILMDVQMPEVDGIEATREIRRSRTIARVPIVALTAMSSAADRERCRAAGFDAFLTKPVRPEQIAEVIAAMACVGSRD